MSEYIPNPEMIKFWQQECIRIFDAITSHKYWLAMIQFRYDWAMKEIAKRYGIGPKFTLSDLESKDSGGEGMTLPAACRIDDGIPTLVFFVPCLKGIFLEAQRRFPHNFRKAFESTAVIGFLHELDHLALGLVDPEQVSLDKIVAYESIAWGETCERTVRLFCEVYRYPISHSDSLYYGKWIECGRNSDSQRWKDFILSLYKKIEWHAR